MSTENKSNETRSVVKVYTGGVASKATRIESSRGITGFSLPTGTNYKLWLIPKVTTKDGKNIKMSEAEFITNYLPSEVFISELLGYTSQDLDEGKFPSVYANENYKPSVTDMIVDLIQYFCVENGETLISQPLNAMITSRKEAFITSIFGNPELNADINYKGKTPDERFEIFKATLVTNPDYAGDFCEKYISPMVTSFIETRTDIYIWSASTASLMIKTEEIEHFARGVLRNRADFPGDYTTFRAMGDIDQLLSWFKFISTESNKIFRSIRFNTLFNEGNETVRNAFSNWVTTPIKGGNRSTVSSPRELVFLSGFENTTNKDFVTISSSDWKVGSYQVKYSNNEKSTYYKLTKTANEGASNSDTDFVIVIAKMTGDTTADVKKNLEFNSATTAILESENMIDRNLIIDLLTKLVNDTAFGSSSVFRNVLNVENELEYFRDYVIKSELLESEFFDEEYYNLYKARLDDLGIVCKKFSDSEGTANKLEEMFNNTEFGGGELF